MTPSQNNVRQKQTEDLIRIQDLFSLCISKWRWFALLLIVAVCIAILYLRITPLIYTRSASILIKEDSKGKSLSSDIAEFADMGLFQTNANVNNELISLQSPAIILDVVKRLHLDVNYYSKDHFYSDELYGPTLPITVSFAELSDNESAMLTVKLAADNIVELSYFVRNGEELSEGNILKGRLQDTIVTPLGKITVIPTPAYEGEPLPVVHVSRSSLYDTTNKYASNLDISLSDEKASVINLSFKDVSIQRAEDVLNMLISVYNENWVKDKNQIAVSTSMFINERLQMIERELGNVDQDISLYKSEHLLPDVQMASNMYMTSANEANTQILALNNQIYMARYIRNYLNKDSNKMQLLPANSGIEGSNIEAQITEYNTKLLQRNSLVANSSEQNPLVINLDQGLQSMRKTIVISIDNQVLALDTQIRNLQKNEQQTIARIAASPTQAKYLISVERQQKIKEALYLFLLQKREENELSQAFTAYNTRIITPPYGKMEPTFPVKRNVLLIAIILGFLIPVVVIFILENTNTTVRGRKDIEVLSLPFMGEIPLAYSAKKYFFQRKRQDNLSEIVVKEKSRDIVNEAFRVVRTNLEFMLNKDIKNKVIMVSSANPGSGKTFITMNLATSLAIKKKKTLAIDLDLRKASLSAYVNSPEKGISDFLNGQVDSITDIIVKEHTYPNLDIIPVGTIPPNPTELLFDSRLESMLTKLRGMYDCILIDCPPIEIVEDTSIINKHIDMTLFVIRAELLERSMIREIEKLYTEQKYLNMSTILNGTIEVHARYGYHKYGYYYGKTNNN